MATTGESKKMNELKTKTEKTTDGTPKKNPWRRLPKGGKISVIVVGILAVLAVLAALYVNGKLDLLRYDCLLYTSPSPRD